VDRNGQLLAFARVNGAFPATIENAIAKASTAAQLGSPTRILQDAVDGGRTSYLAIKGLVPLQGGVPIVLNGTVLGGIGCSGADAAIDELIADVGAERVVPSRGAQG
jgi:glc operon protein GlcG